MTTMSLSPVSPPRLDEKPPARLEGPCPDCGAEPVDGRCKDAPGLDARCGTWVTSAYSITWAVPGEAFAPPGSKAPDGFDDTEEDRLFGCIVTQLAPGFLDRGYKIEPMPITDARFLGGVARTIQALKVQFPELEVVDYPRGVVRIQLDHGPALRHIRFVTLAPIAGDT